MRRLHRNDLYCWSVFNERLDIDFNSYLWVREGGNVVIDPLPMSAHDREHLRTLGGASTCVITNADHVRGAAELIAELDAGLLVPAADSALIAQALPTTPARTLADGDEVVPGLRAFEMKGSKTPGELALLLEETTLITGDLVRAHRPDRLMLLKPEPGLPDRPAALASVERLLAHTGLETVLVGDGWPLFHDGWRKLRALIDQEKAIPAEARAGARAARAC